MHTKIQLNCERRTGALRYTHDISDICKFLSQTRIMRGNTLYVQETDSSRPPIGPIFTGHHPISVIPEQYPYANCTRIPVPICIIPYLLTSIYSSLILQIHIHSGHRCMIPHQILASGISYAPTRITCSRC